VPPVKIPEFPPTPKVETSVPVPPEKQKEQEPEPPLPKDKAEPPPPESPWAKLGAGVHRLFSGTDLKDWTQSGAWAVRGGEALRITVSNGDFPATAGGGRKPRRSGKKVETHAGRALF